MILLFLTLQFTMVINEKKVTFQEWQRGKKDRGKTSALSLLNCHSFSRDDITIMTMNDVNVQCSRKWVRMDSKGSPNRTSQHFFKDSLYREPSRITRMHIHSFLDLCKIYLLSIHNISGTRDTTISKIGTAHASMKLRVIHFAVYKNIFAVPSILLYR